MKNETQQVLTMKDRLSNLIDGLKPETKVEDFLQSVDIQFTLIINKNLISDPFLIEEIQKMKTKITTTQNINSALFLDEVIKLMIKVSNHMER